MITHAFYFKQIFTCGLSKILKLILYISKYIYPYKLMIIIFSYLYLLFVLIVINYKHFPDLFLLWLTLTFCV